MNKKHQIPTPAHPHKRREALPWQQPKATEEDPEALRRVQAILNSPSYRRADNDSDFLAQDGVRGVRLQIDYLKPELLLEEHEIHQTIVVFGSTRICEPAAARRKVEALRGSLAADPSNMELGRRLAIAERIHAKSHYYDVAREFGGLVGRANHGARKHHTVAGRNDAVLNAGGDRLLHGGGPHAARTGDLLRAVFHSPREPQGGHCRDHRSPERAMDAANGPQRDHGGMRHPSGLSLSPA